MAASSSPIAANYIPQKLGELTAVVLRPSSLGQRWGDVRPERSHAYRPCLLSTRASPDGPRHGNLPVCQGGRLLPAPDLEWDVSPDEDTLMGSGHRCRTHSLTGNVQ